MAYVGSLFSFPSMLAFPLKLVSKCLVMAGLMVGLAGCGGSSDLATSLGLNSQKANTGLQNGKSQQPIAVARLIGAPASLSPKLLGAIKSAGQKRNWVLTNDQSKATYLLHGHFTAYPTKSGAKLSYIWDIKDRKGVHLHRVLGSEAIKGKKTSNGWSLVNDTVIASVGDAAGEKLNGWFLKQAPAGQIKPVNTLDGPKRIAAIEKRDKGMPEDPLVTGAVSKRDGPLFTYVKPVQGAPGDGRISLTNALRRELKKNGIALSNKGVQGGYTVQGLVKLQKPYQEKQKIEIVWNVFDGKGNKVGTVSQRNNVPIGSLNGAWGPTAVAAASAAAKGIVKLLPNSK